MTYRRITILTSLALLLGGGAGAQSLPDMPSSPKPQDLADMAGAVRNLAGDKLLVRDLLGKTLTGTDGKPIGTVEDFVVIPGGRIVAAIVAPQNGDDLAVPFNAVKLGASNAAGAMSLPFKASEVTGMKALSDLAADLVPQDGG